MLPPGAPSSMDLSVAVRALHGGPTNMALNVSRQFRLGSACDNAELVMVQASERTVELVRVRAPS